MEEQQQQKSSGWKKGCLIGCGVLLILAIVFVVVLFFAMGKLVNYAATQFPQMIENYVEERLPENYDKQKFRETFDTGIKALKEGRIDNAEINQITDHMNAAMQDGKLDTEETDELLRLINEASEN